MRQLEDANLVADIVLGRSRSRKLSELPSEHSWPAPPDDRGDLEHSRHAPKHHTLDISLVVIAGLVPAIHLVKAWTAGTSPVVTMGRRLCFK